MRTEIHNITLQVDNSELAILQYALEACLKQRIDDHYAAFPKNFEKEMGATLVMYRQLSLAAGWQDDTPVAHIKCYLETKSKEFKKHEWGKHLRRKRK